MIRVAVRRAGATRFSVRTLRFARRPAYEIAVALDRRGETTVAWIESNVRSGLLRTAFRSPEGRWSPVQTLSSSAAGGVGNLRLASARDGTVALTFSTRQPRIALEGAAAAWRSAGHRFGAVRRLALPHALTQPTLAADAAGNFYLAGNARCRGVVFTATARWRRFGAGRTIAPGPVREMSLAVAGRGSAVLTWLAAACGSTGPVSGVPMTATLDHGTITPAVGLGDPHGTELNLAGARGGAEVSWQTSSGPQPLLRAATIAVDGTPRPPQTRSDGWAAAAADSRGNELVMKGADLRDEGRRTATRRADGGPLARAPIRVAGAYWRTRLAGAADGAGLAAIHHRRHSARIVAAIWRPATDCRESARCASSPDGCE